MCLIKFISVGNKPHKESWDRFIQKKFIQIYAEELSTEKCVQQ